MCFVRKLLDYVFTRHELRWLDDILPESHKKEKEDKKKVKGEQSFISERGGREGWDCGYEGVICYKNRYRFIH